MSGPTGEEYVCSVPVEDFHRRQGCAVDYGGSLVKLAFTEPSPDPDRIQIRCVSFNKENMRDALTYLKDKAGSIIVKDEPVNTCGIGIQKYVETFDEILGVSIQNMLEFDCFVDAFRYLSGIQSPEEFFYPESQKVKDIRQDHLENSQVFVEKMKEVTDKGAGWKFAKEDDSSEDSVSSSSSSEDEDDEDVRRTARRARRRARKQRRRDRRMKRRQQRAEHCGRLKKSYIKYPTLLLMCGSGACPVIVQPDGDYQSLDVHPQCGRFFMGLGRLLTGAESFDELVSLAEAGDQSELNVWSADLVKDSGDPYAIVPKYMMPYGFGKAVDKEPSSFRREDVAATVLATVGQYLAQTFHLWSWVMNVKDVYFFGGFVNSQVVRDEIGKNLVLRSSVNSLGRHTNYHFVRSGAYLGVLGCLFAALRTKPEQKD